MPVKQICTWLYHTWHPVQPFSAGAPRLQHFLQQPEVCIYSWDAWRHTRSGKRSCRMKLITSSNCNTRIARLMIYQNSYPTKFRNTRVKHGLSLMRFWDTFLYFRSVRYFFHLAVACGSFVCIGIPVTDTRVANQDYTLLDGRTIKAGQILFTVPAAHNRDPELYDDPDTFDPNRFLRPTPDARLQQDNKVNWPKYRHTSFGTGR